MTCYGYRDDVCHEIWTDPSTAAAWLLSVLPHRRRHRLDPWLVPDHERGRGRTDGAARRARPYPDPRARASMVARISPRRTDARHRTVRPAPLRRRRRRAGSHSHLGPSRNVGGEAAGRTARCGAASPVPAEPPRLLRICRQGRRRLRHRACPGPARRPPPYRRGGPVQSVAEVVGRPSLRRARSVRWQRPRFPDPRGSGRRAARAGPSRPCRLRHTP